MGPLRRSVQRSDLVASGGKADMRDHRKSVAPDPKQHFATANYRIAKDLLDQLVGSREKRFRDREAERLGGREI
jgi:hypothetical protein